MEVEDLKLFDKKSKQTMRRYLTRAERKGWFPRSTEGFMGVLDSIFQTEVKNRQYQIAVKLERKELIENRRKKEEKHHKRTVKRIDETLEIFKAERKLIKEENLKKMDEVIKDKQKFSKIRDNFIEMVQNSFLESDIDPIYAMASLEILTNAFNEVEKRGDINGLLDYIEEQQKELKRVRSEEKERGREGIGHNPIPPIPVWKIWALGALGTFFIVVGIYCWIDIQGVPHLWIACMGLCITEAGLWLAVLAACAAWGC